MPTRKFWVSCSCGQNSHTFIFHLRVTDCSRCIAHASVVTRGRCTAMAEVNKTVEYSKYRALYWSALFYLQPFHQNTQRLAPYTRLVCNSFAPVCTTQLTLPSQPNGKAQWFADIFRKHLFFKSQRRLLQKLVQVARDRCFEHFSGKSNNPEFSLCFISFLF